MPRVMEKRTIELLEAAFRRKVKYETPQWLIRPGKEEAEHLWRKIRLIYRRLTDGMELPEVMPLRERRVVDGVFGGRGIRHRIVEFDESQHFNPFRAQSLRLYTEGAELGFPKAIWLKHARQGRVIGGGGWAKPKPPLFPMPGGRHRQRAFRDALADLLPPLYGYAPTLRIADFEVEGWLWERGAATRLRRLVEDRLEGGQL